MPSSPIEDGVQNIGGFVNENVKRETFNDSLGTLYSSVPDQSTKTYNQISDQGINDKSNITQINQQLSNISEDICSTTKLVDDNPDKMHFNEKALSNHQNNNFFDEEFHRESKRPNFNFTGISLDEQMPKNPYYEPTNSRGSYITTIGGLECEQIANTENFERNAAAFDSEKSKSSPDYSNLKDKFLYQGYKYNFCESGTQLQKQNMVQSHGYMSFSENSLHNVNIDGETASDYTLYNDNNDIRTIHETAGLSKSSKYSEFATSSETLEEKNSTGFRQKTSNMIESINVAPGCQGFSLESSNRENSTIIMGFQGYDQKTHQSLHFNDPDEFNSLISQATQHNIQKNQLKYSTLTSIDKKYDLSDSRTFNHQNSLQDSKLIHYDQIRQFPQSIGEINNQEYMKNGKNVFVSNYESNSFKNSDSEKNSNKFMGNIDETRFSNIVSDHNAAQNEATYATDNSDFQYQSRYNMADPYSDNGNVIDGYCENDLPQKINSNSNNEMNNNQDSRYHQIRGISQNTPFFDPNYKHIDNFNRSKDSEISFGEDVNIDLENSQLNVSYQNAIHNNQLSFSKQNKEYNDLINPQSQFQPENYNFNSGKETNDSCHSSNQNPRLGYDDSINTVQYSGFHEPVDNAEMNYPLKENITHASYGVATEIQKNDHYGLNNNNITQTSSLSNGRIQDYGFNRSHPRVEYERGRIYDYKNPYQTPEERVHPGGMFTSQKRPICDSKHHSAPGYMNNTANLDIGQMNNNVPNYISSNYHKNVDYTQHAFSSFKNDVLFCDRAEIRAPNNRGHVSREMRLRYAAQADSYYPENNESTAAFRKWEEIQRALNQSKDNRQSFHLQKNVCAHCGTDKTSLWRRFEGLFVCNACGLYYKMHGIRRPIFLKSDNIRRRKRTPR